MFTITALFNIKQHQAFLFTKPCPLTTVTSKSLLSGDFLINWLGEWWWLICTASCESAGWFYDVHCLKFPAELFIVTWIKILLGQNTQTKLPTADGNMRIAAKPTVTSFPGSKMLTWPHKSTGSRNATRFTDSLWTSPFTLTFFSYLYF